MTQPTDHRARLRSTPAVDVFALVIVAGVLTSTAAACGADDDCEGRACLRAGGPRDGVDVDGEGDDGPGGPSAPACTVTGKPHIGLGGADLAATYDSPAFVDRARAKPYSALVSEYTRVLGAKNKPSLLDGAGGTFGVPSPRWYVEPIASAVFVNTAYNIAFEGCLKLTGEIAGGTAEPRFAVAPTAETAKAVCTEWTRSFWSRDATPEQLDACVSIALDSAAEVYGGGSIAEVTRPITPKRQWAYACASVLSATGFLMY